MSKESYKLSDIYEIGSAPITPRVTAPTTPRLGSNAPPTPRLDSNAPPTPLTSLPPSQFHSPSLSRSPLLSMGEHIGGGGDRVTDATPTVKTPRAGRTPRNFTPRNFTPRFITPLGSPIRKALHLTKLDPQDAWLPITESRNGNAYYAGFHTLCSGIGIQALVLPVAFTTLGWTWGIILMTIAFIWQLYTLYILVQLHESTETGLRYSRYLQLLSASFGERVSKILGIFPIMYLSAGTCVTLIVIGGGSFKLFFNSVCGTTCSVQQPTTVEWYLIFTCAAVVLSQLPNLNSIAGVSLIGSITAVMYCTVIWAVSVGEGRMPGVSYKPVRSNSQLSNVFEVFNALGIIAFAFRGHNLALEIQATMPSSEKHPSRVPMWKGTQVAYALIAVCLYPLTIGGYWAYGQTIPANGGMLTALYVNHSKDASPALLGLASLSVIINAMTSFQIYGMPTFDDMESQFTTRWKRACPWWLRAAIRTFFGFMCFFLAVAFPFVSSLAGLVGGIALPITLAYPCFMWIKWKKPKKFGPMWCLHWFLGVVGMILSVILMIAGVYSIVDTGVKFTFFHPE